MTVLKISEFEGYDADEFTEFVSAETDGNFVIYIPKETVLFYSTNEDISQEYAIAAYIGEELYGIASKFEYSSAGISSSGEFTFTIRSTDFDALGELLAEISSVFGNSELIEPIKFVGDVDDFMEKFRNHRVVCQDLFDIAVMYRE